MYYLNTLSSLHSREPTHLLKIRIFECFLGVLSGLGEFTGSECLQTVGGHAGAFISLELPDMHNYRAQGIVMMRLYTLVLVLLTLALLSPSLLLPLLTLLLLSLFHVLV